MKEIYKKELMYYLNNPIGYIVVVLFAVFANFLFVKDIFVVGSASMRPFFSFLPWLFMIFIPAITMRAIAEEKRTNTIETLLTLPLSETQIVLAKFLALLTLVGIGLVLTFSLPVSLSMITQQTSTRLYFPEIIVGYIGALFLSASFISVSFVFSSQTKNQVVAFLLSVITLFLLLVISSDFTGFLPKMIQDFLSYLAPITHMQNFIKGVVDLRSTVYFVGLTSFCLFYTIVELEKRS